MDRFLPREVELNEPPPGILFGYASVRSRGGTSVFDLTSVPVSAAPFHGTDGDRREARREVESGGFTILGESRLGYALAGSPGAFEQLTGGRVVTRDRLVYAEAGRQRYVTHVDIVGENQPAAL